MSEKQVSLTALVTAFARAYHALHDDPKVFDDNLVSQLFTDKELEFFGQNVAKSLAFLDPAAAAAYPDEASALAQVMRLQTAPVTLSRSRYTEDYIQQALARGVEQYVILGAGLDTFAFRQRHLLERLQVFELDHPVTQADKRRRVAAAGWEQPPGLHWVPMDFSRDDLGRALRDAGYDRRKLSLFSWLGVVYYLPRVQVFATLRAIARCALPGSELIFDYFDADALNPARAGKLVQRVQDLVRNTGEPFKTGLEPSTLAAELAAAGWRLEEDLDPRAIEEQVLGGGIGGYHAFEHVHFARAIVLRED